MLSRLGCEQQARVRRAEMLGPRQRARWLELLLAGCLLLRRAERVYVHL